MPGLNLDHNFPWTFLLARPGCDVLGARRSGHGFGHFVLRTGGLGGLPQSDGQASGAETQVALGGIGLVA